MLASADDMNAINIVAVVLQWHSQSNLENNIKGTYSYTGTYRSLSMNCIAVTVNPRGNATRQSTKLPAKALAQTVPDDSEAQRHICHQLYLGFWLIKISNCSLPSLAEH